MILQRLYALAQRERLLDDVAFEMQPVPFVVQISKEGQYRGIEERRGEIVIPPKKKGGAEKRVPDKGMIISVPRPHGNTANQGFARYFVDTLPRVLPVTVDEKDRKKAEASRATYWQQIGRAAEETKDPAVKAVQAFGASLASDEALAAKVRADVEARKPGASDRVTFAFLPDGGATILDRDGIRAWYLPVYQAAVEKRVKDAVIGICQITNKVGPLPKTHSFDFKGIPGGQKKGTKLISFDKSAFESYGLKKSANAGIGVVGADGYSRAIIALLSNTLPSAAARGDKTNLKLSWKKKNGKEEGVTYLYWTQDDEDLKFMSLFDDPSKKDELLKETAEEDRPELAAVERTMTAAVVGKRDQLSAKPNQFYLLGLSGNSARAIVRDYLEQPLSRVKACQRKWFDDLRIADMSKDYSGRPNDRFSLWQLALATALDSDGIVPGSFTRLLRAALTDGPVSESLLVSCLQRLRAEGSEGFRANRMALIKLILKRRETPVSETLNPDERHPAYVYGRFLAACEEIQYAALGDVNVNIVDRYYGRLSTAPSFVLRRLIDGALEHLKKIKTEKAGLAVNLDQKLSKVIQLMPAKPLSGQMSFEDQARFSIGYYHEKAKRFERMAEAKARKLADNNSNPPATTKE